MTRAGNAISPQSLAPDTALLPRPFSRADRDVWTTCLRLESAGRAGRRRASGRGSALRRVLLDSRPSPGIRARVQDPGDVVYAAPSTGEARWRWDHQTGIETTGQDPASGEEPGPAARACNGWRVRGLVPAGDDRRGRVFSRGPSFVPGWGWSLCFTRAGDLVISPCAWSSHSVSIVAGGSAARNGFSSSRAARS